MDREKYKALITESVNELNSIMQVSFKEQVKDLVKSALGRSVRTKDPLFWPAGLLMLGLVEARKNLMEAGGEKKAGSADKGNESGGAAGDTAELIRAIDDAIGKHVRLWKDRYKAKISFIDDALSGAALIKLYCQDGLDEGLKELCKETADSIYEYLSKAPRDKSGAIAYNAERSDANVFADGVGQTTMFLSLYGRVFDVQEATELAKVQLTTFKKYGCDERSGLPYHGYAMDSDSKVVKKGVLSWGRAAGWLIMGLSEFVSCCAPAAGSYTLENKNHRHRSIVLYDFEVSEIKSWYNKLSDALLSYQRGDGGYAWQIQATEGPLDTSATGMILYGLMNGIEQEDDSKLKSLSKKTVATVNVLDKNVVDGKVNSALSSCDDFGVHYQTYGHYPWGQGAVLAAISLLKI